MRALISMWLVSALAAPCLAGPADVLSATAQCSAQSVCTFTVTVRHDDDGWGHYADRWQVLSPEGELIATRVLRHPHAQQPFTRKLADVEVPESLARVRIRARDSEHGYGGAEVEIVLRRAPAER